MFIIILLLILLIISGIFTFRSRDKKAVIGLSIVVVCLLGIGIFRLQPILLPTFRDTIQFNWNINLPKPYKESTIASNAGGFPVNGETYVVMDYHNSDDIHKINNCIKWQNKNESIIMKSEKFIVELEKNLGTDNKSKEKIQSNIPNLNFDLKYYYKTKKDFSSILFIFIPEEKRIYIMQSIY